MKRLIIYSIAFVLLLPFMFTRPEDSIMLQSYLLKCVLPAMIVVVFWVNYLWILPRYNSQGGKRRVALWNLALLLACSVGLAEMHHIEFSQRKSRQKQPCMEARHRPPHAPKPPRSEMHFIVNTGLRDGLYLVLGIFVAYSLLASERMKRLQQQKQDAELARQKAELRSLRNQVSPHFLLNTLNNIYSLSLIDSQRTGDAVMKLSRLLRHTLYDSQQERVSLKKEAEFMQSYVELMSLRLAPNIKVSSNLQVADDSATEVAPLIFISLLENAFKHGTAPMEQCHIHIELREVVAESGVAEVYFRITNSLHPKGENDRSGHGIGLPTVQKRLNHYYPHSHSLHYGPQADEWVAEIRIFP